MRVIFRGARTKACRSRLVVACASAAFIAGAAAPAFAASPPAARTGPAQEIQADTATVTGTVDPDGSATSYYFEYGPTAAYGKQTSAVAAGSGNTDVFASATLSGLEPSTTYHYRLVAVGDGVTVVGKDLTFTTSAPPAPGVSTGEATDVTPTTALLAGTVDPHGVATSYYFEYGPKTLTARTPAASAGTGTANVTVTASLSALAPYTTYYYRLVAVGARAAEGTVRSFRTAELPAQLTLASVQNPVGAGAGVTFTGTLSGTGVGARTVALEIDPYPYTAGFQQFGSAELTSTNGTFSFALPELTIDSRVRAVTVGGSPALASATLLEQVYVRVSVHLHRHGRSVRFLGLVAPAGAPVTIEIQRRLGDRWQTIARTSTHPIPGDLAAFSRTIAHPRRGEYRVLALVNDGSLLPGRSSTLKIG